MDEDPRTTAARKLRLSLELFEVGEALVRQKIRREHPELDEREVAALVAAWRLERPGAEHGDGPGRPAAWPRSCE